MQSTCTLVKIYNKYSHRFPCSNNCNRMFIFIPNFFIHVSYLEKTGLLFSVQSTSEGRGEWLVWGWERDWLAWHGCICDVLNKGFLFIFLYLSIFSSFYILFLSWFLDFFLSFFLTSVFLFNIYYSFFLSPFPLSLSLLFKIIFLYFFVNVLYLFQF